MSLGETRAAFERVLDAAGEAFRTLAREAGGSEETNTAPSPSSDGYVHIGDRCWVDPVAAQDLMPKLTSPGAAFSWEEQQLLLHLVVSYRELVGLGADAGSWARQISNMSRPFGACV